MKAIFDEYLKIIMYIIFGILLVMSSYLIILNIHHYKSLSSNIIVSELDYDYSKYKDNVTLIEDKLSKYNSSDKIINNLNNIHNNMKKGGVFRLVPKTKLSYKEIYELNDYFMEELINNSWIHIINELDISVKYQNIMDMLIGNSKYLNSVFTGNSLILSDSGLDNKITDNYHLILKNYLMYSNVILDICNELGGENDEVNQ